MNIMNTLNITGDPTITAGHNTGVVSFTYHFLTWILKNNFLGNWLPTSILEADIV